MRIPKSLRIAVLALPAIIAAAMLLMPSTMALAADAPKSTTLSNPLGTDDIRVVLGNAIRIVTGISGSLALLMFVYGGFVWVTSQGNPEKVKKGKQIFISASLGLFIIFGSYALLSVVFKALSGVGS